EYDIYRTVTYHGVTHRTATENCYRKNCYKKEEGKLEQLVYILCNNLPLYYSANDTQKEKRRSYCDKENQKQKTQQRGENENVRIT
ncbi:MAG: hypothetical protein J6A05_03260, partial [Oscillospiraceae bacterium]|nr:hypothetical protein [Oscillospiraceae bacterium]